MTWAKTEKPLRAIALMVRMLYVPQSRAADNDEREQEENAIRKMFRGIF